MADVIPFVRDPNRFTTHIQPKERFISLDDPLLQELESILGRFDSEMGATFKIRDYLRSLRGHISTSAIATARVLLRGTSLDDLKEIAEHSTPSQWAAKPGYFMALVEEIRSRA